jgi:thiol-disulfide isomerase/thioredoxin
MSEAEIKAGSHGERYALLVYKMLAEAKHISVANKLLDQTINTLEKLANDTLNKERFAHKNILAYAYYIKYQNALKTDSVLAFSYLARASYNSPKQNERKVWSSFYDHFFLHSKENYRTDFIQDLLKNKNNLAQASNLLVEQLTSDPTSIDEVRDIYKANFPDQSFEAFFKDKVIDTWLPAPDFALTDIKDNKHSLADFKNKWLMLDFWGTWCGPCCAEMPDLNRFNQELKDDKFKNVRFLSVACSDTKNKVSAYLQRNNFDITAAMADGNIEKQYGVTGYPFKVLIAPNGKMMKLKFGDDWHAIVEKLKDFYPTSND